MHYLSKVHVSSYQLRLESLIEARLQAGADKAAIDARIWDIFGENWAVMFTDLSGFSRYVAEYGIIHFLQNIHESQRIFDPCIEVHDGVLVKVEGDSMLVLFRQPDKAVECAIDMQHATTLYNRDKSDAEKILLCVGIGYGRILTIGDRDVFGEEVNAASKLGEDVAQAGQILVTGAVANAMQASASIGLELIDSKQAWIKSAYAVRYPD